MSGIAVFTTLLAGGMCWAQAQPGEKQLTARELFYSASDQSPAKPAASQAKAAAPKPAKPAETNARKRQQETKAADGRKVPTGVAPGARSRTGNDGALVQAAYSPAEHSGVPLGLRYTILKLVDGRMVEVAPDTVFRAGDRIQIAVEANGAGYLYIVNQGTSGTWKPLFPSAEIEDGNNRIEKGRSYVMPPKSRIYFDEQAGEEKLFIVFSRQPEPDLEKMIYGLRGGGEAAPAAEPAAPRPRREPVMLASNLQIEDRLVGRLRTVYARDLVIEKVDDEAAAPASTPAGRKEKAVYVVNPSGSPDSRVVADIRLTHR